jgi:uncharacterized protein (DUF58 family)
VARNPGLLSGYKWSGRARAGRSRAGYPPVERSKPGAPADTAASTSAGPRARARYERELPAQLLARIEFEVLRRLDGRLFGDYSGLFHGPSLDLAEVREYQPGDEVRRIDWFVTARTGSVHVRQYREEREVIAWLVLDGSRSMDFGTRRATKREVALEFTAVAAAVLARGGNKVGAIGFSDAGYTLAPLASGRRQPIALLQRLMARRPATPSEAPAQEAPPLGAVLDHTARLLRRKSLVFLVSDFLHPRSAKGEVPWERELRRLALRHDVIAVRISDPAERELPNAGDLRLWDPESGRELWVDTSDRRVRLEHARLAADRRRAVERTFRGAGVDLLDLSTERDLVRPLVRFTLERSARRR